MGSLEDGRSKETKEKLLIEDEENEKFDHKSANQKLEEILGYGKFQKFQIWIFAPLICFIGGMNTYQLTFTVTRKDFRCQLPDNMEQNLALNSFDNYTEYVGKCEMVALSQCLNGSTPPINAPEELFEICENINANETVPCEFGYRHAVYSDNLESFFWSLSAENDWVCDKEGYGSNLLMAQVVGILINTAVFMQLSDSWGRRPVLHITNATYIVTRFLILVTYPYYWPTLVIVAVGSAFFPVGIRVGYILIAEYTNDKGRLLLYISGWVFWVLGVAFLALVAWDTAEWFSYTLATTLPNLLLVPFFWLSPESPRLLLTQNKTREAEEIVSRIQRINGGGEKSEKLGGELEVIASAISKEKKQGVVAIFSSARMRWIMLLFCVTWSVEDFFYLGGQMNVENLAGNQFINFTIVAFTEFPSVFIGEFLINKIGRRWSHVLCMVTATAFFVAILPISNDENLAHVVTILAICAKTASNVGWFCNWVQNMELFPTSARVSGMNFCATVSAVIGIVAPYVILLGANDIRFMYAIFAAAGVIGIIATSLLPESHKQDFPECIEDIEKREPFKFFSWKVWE